MISSILQMSELRLVGWSGSWSSWQRNVLGRGEKFWYSGSLGLALPLGTAHLLLGLSALPSIKGGSGRGLLDLE